MHTNFLFIGILLNIHTHTHRYICHHTFGFSKFSVIFRFAITPQLYLRVYDSIISQTLVLMLQIIKGCLIIPFCHTEVSLQKERKHKDGSLILRTKKEQEKQLYKTKVRQSLLKLIVEFGHCWLCETKITSEAAANIKGTLSSSGKQWS